MVGLTLGAAGLALIGANLDAATTPTGLALVLCAALSWACANVVVKAAAREHGPFSALGLMVWSSLFAAPLLALLALGLEGGGEAVLALRRADAGAWSAALWQSLGNTLFGFGVWNWLLSRHAAAVVAPLALLVPVCGLVAAWSVLAEPMQGWKILACALILAGVALTVFER